MVRVAALVAADVPFRRLPSRTASSAWISCPARPATSRRRPRTGARASCPAPWASSSSVATLCTCSACWPCTTTEPRSERQRPNQVYFKGSCFGGGEKTRRVPPQDGSLQCPSCKTIYGEKTGTQPKGKMEIYSIGQSLPGHPDCGTIHIIYSIPPGIQVGVPDAPGMREGCFIIHVAPPPGSGASQPRTAVHLQRLPSLLLPPRQPQRQEGEELRSLR